MRLVLCPATVETHVNRAMAKVGRAAVVSSRLRHRAGLIGQPGPPAEY